VGDVGLALGIFAVFYQFKAVDYATIFASVYEIKQDIIPIRFLSGFFHGISVLDLTCIFLFIGAVGKSAQLGLHS
jgi:NADH-quinone oxidoreductase subunit L